MQGTKHHMIMVADVEGFGDPSRTKPHQRAVRDGLYDVMQEAFASAGVLWEACYREDRGDAVFALAPADTDKALFADALPLALVTRLRVHNATHPDEQRIRLRLALHAGDVHYDDRGVTSTALTLAFRLNDATPLKVALAESPGELAVIASDWFFDDVVRHTPGAAPATWRQVAVEVKEAVTTGWIALPDHPYSSGANLARVGAQRAGSPRQSPSEVVPRQLPASARDFTGRADHLAALDALLPTNTGGDGDQGQSVVITAVDGAGGIGKTTLAVYWAHRVQEHFPDGTLHVNLRGYGPGTPVSPGEALDGFLRALDMPPRRIPAEVEARAALFRSLLAGKRMLIVLDNARHPDQVRPLLPGAAGCMVLVTSRDSLTGLVITDTARRLTLDLLTLDEARDFVTSILGSERVAVESELIPELIRLCARLPLALRIAASRVVAHPHLTVADIVAELADDHSRLDALSQSGDERAAVRAVFDWSYQQLPGEHARLFRRLGLHPGPEMSLEAAAAVAELSPAEARRLLVVLTEAHLIEPSAGGRYRFHDLLRAYAAEQARRYDPTAECHHALSALLIWYAHTAQSADKQLYPAHPRFADPVHTPCHSHPITTRDQAWAWVLAEQENLRAALYCAVESDLDQCVCALAVANRFLGMIGNWNAYLEVVNSGHFAARRSGDNNLEVVFLDLRSELLGMLRRWDEAQADVDRAIELACGLDDSELKATALNTRGVLELRRRRFASALKDLTEALPLSRNAGNERFVAVVEGNLGVVYNELGEHQKALKYCLCSLAGRRNVGDFEGEAFGLAQVGRAWQGLGVHNKAVICCRDAIKIGRSLQSYRYLTVAQPLSILATSLSELGFAEEAQVCWREAVEIYDEYGLVREATDVRRRLAAQEPSAP